MTTLLRAWSSQNTTLRSSFRKTARTSFERPIRIFSFSSNSNSSSSNSNNNSNSKPQIERRKEEGVAVESESKPQECVRHWMEQLRSPPNIITSLRILSTPYLSHLIVTEQYELALLGGFMAAGSDCLDGYIARTYNMQTVLGSFLDPLADKFLINVVAFSLCYSEILPVPLVALWTLRDVGLMIGTFAFVKSRTEKGNFVIDPGTTPLQVSATNISKINTVLQFLTLSLAVVQPVYGLNPEILESCCWLTGGTTIASALSYIGHDAFIESGNSLQSDATKRQAVSEAIPPTPKSK